MVRFAYNLLLALLAPLAIPYWIARGHAKGHRWDSVPEALGRVPVSKDTTNHPPIWFHAVSVGEIQSSVPLLEALRRELPGTPLYVSAGTATGLALAKSKLRGLVSGTFRAPIDLPGCVSGIFSRLRPRLLIVAETELWPNYFFQANRHGVETLIVNGRISDRAARRYRQFRFLFRRVLGCASEILAQSGRDRARFLAAGARRSTTHVAGNLKYDFDRRRSARSELPGEVAKLLERSAPELVFVAGSTREGEESKLSASLLAIAKRVPRSLSVIAPRHPHRFDEAARELAATGLPLIRRSRLAGLPPPALPAILLLDTLGELASVYGRADLVFVGGSLNGWGGHNVLEPIAFGKPVVVGPSMQNFRQITEDLLAESGMIQVDGSESLSSVLGELSTSRKARDTLGRAGKAAAAAKRGASEHAARRAAALYRAAQPRHPASMLRSAALLLPSVAWAAVARIRRKAYAAGLLACRPLALPVISVGNLSVGGTGKTPTVAWLVEQLASRGYVSAVLTRGYGRTDHSTRLLTAGDPADPRTMGDEPAMLSRRFARVAPGTLIAVGADRHKSGQLVEARREADFFVLDDGFQHLQLARDLNIVLLDASRPFDNGFTLPLGRLRETPASLEHADIVLLTRCVRGMDYSGLERAIRRASPRTRVFRSRMAARDLAPLQDGEARPLGVLRGKRVAAFCGIGQPESFFGEAMRLGYELVAERRFPDHNRYTPGQLKGLCRMAASSRAEAFLTTSKDAMNLGDGSGLNLPAYCLRIDVGIDRGDDLVEEVLATRNA